MMIQEQLLYQQLQSIPEAVRNFILQLHRAIVNHHNADLSTLYEQSWQKLSEKFYAKEAWPEAEFIAPLVQNEPIVLVLYRELYYRHVYSRLQPTLEQRFASYENYLELFNYVLSTCLCVN
jgi:translation initiation factor 3 subunit L